MLNYAGEAGEAGNGHTASFGQWQFFRTAYGDPKNWG